ncbi:LysR family transcriptional regulator [Bosea sp. RCC_152_1]|uniref:LysR family transcriptional regulator n=1 Tax=unclassified Bosea (in: a-proteobacteria) TaxID=2653178 RepID=UPI0011503AED
MKAGTVSRAAEILGVTQPGVSRLIAELDCRDQGQVRSACRRIVTSIRPRLAHCRLSYRPHSGRLIESGMMAGRGASLSCGIQ